MTSKIKILFVAQNLKTGGAERLLVNLFGNLDRRRFNLIIALLEKKGELLHLVPADIKVYDLKQNKVNPAFAVIKLLRITYIERPHIVFSMLWWPNIITLITKFLSNTKTSFLISERIHTTLHIKKIFCPYLFKTLLKILYQKADLIIAVSNGVKDDLCRNFSIKSSMIKTIYNPINQEFIWQLATEKITNQSFLEKQPVIISAGRLGKQKGFDLLINAFSIVRKKLSAKLVILGKGRERQRLKTLIENLGLENDVLLAGFAQNPFKFIARSSVFVSPSFYEGFPNALLEAMALGIPVVSTDCPSGPREIIADGENGLLVLVGDVDALANAILRVLQDKDLAMKLSENGRRRIKDFSIDKIIKQYEDIFLSVANSV